MVKVLIVDDHPIVRLGLKELLEELTGFSVGEAGNAAEALSYVSKEKVSVVLMDISMPGRSGLEALHDLKREYPKLPVIMLTIYPEEQYAVRALRAGADGYLSKNSAPAELVQAIQKVLGGGKYVSPSLAEKLAFEMHRETDKPPHELLSDREYEVFCMLGRGLSITEISEKLSLSVKTVSTYRTRIVEKTSLKSNSEIVRYVIDYEL